MHLGDLGLHRQDAEDRNGVEHRHRDIGHGRGDGAEQSADRRSGDGAALPAQGVPGDGAWQKFAGHQAWSERGGGGVEERPRRSEHHRQAEDRPIGGGVGQAHARQDADADDLHEDAQDDDPLAVIAVGRVAGEQGQGEQRQELGQADHAERERRFLHRMVLAGHGIDLPGDGHRLGLGAQHVGHPRHPEQHERALLQERGQAFGRDRRGRRRVGHGRRAPWREPQPGATAAPHRR